MTTEPTKLDAMKLKRDPTALSGISESSSTLHIHEGSAQEPNSKIKKKRTLASNAGSSTNIVTGSKFGKNNLLKSNALQDKSIEGNAAIMDKNLVIINEEDVEDAITYRSKPRKKGQDLSSLGSLLASEN